MTTKNLREFAEATKNELFDLDYKGGEWMCEAIETQETLEQWEESSNRWSERSSMFSGTIAGFPFRSWKNTQSAKGKPRQSMSIVDLGEMRVALPGTDLTYFI